MGTRTRIAAFVTSLLASALPLGASGAEFIGPENCKVCHPAAYDAWKDSQHSRASASLSPKQQKDGRCLSCHSPEQARGNPDVGCETCHGGGQYYSPRYVMKDAELSRAVGMTDPGEKMCLKCHDATAPSLSPFKFVDKLKLIDHWSADRAERKGRASKAAEKAEEKAVAAPPDKAEKSDKSVQASKKDKASDKDKKDKEKSSQ